jgi:hypothetical protein
VAVEVAAGAGARRGGRLPQSLDGPLEPAARLRERVVVGEEPGAGQQHVTRELGVVQLDRQQRIVYPLAERLARAAALDPEVGEEQQPAAPGAASVTP